MNFKEISQKKLDQKELLTNKINEESAQIATNLFDTMCTVNPNLKISSRVSKYHLATLVRNILKYDNAIIHQSLENVPHQANGQLKAVAPMYAHICTLLGHIQTHIKYPEILEANEILQEIEPISLQQNQEILQCQADILQVYKYCLTKTFQDNKIVQSLVIKIVKKLEQ